MALLLCDLFVQFLSLCAAAAAAASRSGRCPARHYVQQLLPLVQAKAWPFTAIISHRMPLQQGVEAYKMFAEVTCYFVTSCMSFSCYTWQSHAILATGMAASVASRCYVLQPVRVVGC